MPRRAPPNPDLLRDLNERQFAAQLRDLFDLFGWARYHSWTSVHSAPGFPDEVLVRATVLAFVELKSDRGKLTEAQRYWLDILAHTDADVAVWRPAMLEEIVEWLRDPGTLPPPGDWRHES